MTHIPFTTVPNEIIDLEGLTSSEKLILIILCRFNPCYPSYTYLSKISGLSRRTIAAIIKNLVIKKEIIYEKGSNKKHQSNRYNIKRYLGQPLHHPRATIAPPLGQPLHPNNTNKNKTNIIKRKSDFYSFLEDQTNKELERIAKRDKDIT